MTFSDLWIDDLSGWPSLHQSGHLTGPAVDLSFVLQEFISSGRATVNPEKCFPGEMELTITGADLFEAFVETEKRCGTELVESDGRRSAECIFPDHQYKCWYVES